MHRLVALLLVATAVCAIARPGPGADSSLAQPDVVQDDDGPLFARPLDTPHIPKEWLLGSLLTKYRPMSQPRALPENLPDDSWVDKEIERLKKMKEIEEVNKRYDPDEWRQRFIQGSFTRTDYDGPALGEEMPTFIRHKYPLSGQILKQLEPMKNVASKSPALIMAKRPLKAYGQQPLEELRDRSHDSVRDIFALTPQDKGYYDPDDKLQSTEKPVTADRPQVWDSKVAALLEPPRQIRQNPNWSKTKTLVAGDIDKIKARLANNKDRYKIPVSLLPVSWLDVSPVDDDEESSNEDGVLSTTKPNSENVLENSTAQADSIYGIAFMAAVGTVGVIAVVAFLIGWFTLSKKAKAAADVDYPAYGVTGPTVDTSGDRKLAHSAHMYHYQHQKQQIIAMERSCMEQRSGSVSDPESEEENEEGDYTVYECPGFATTGDMEVKNPLFSEEPTPTAPGKCEVVKPQPEE